MQVGHLVVWMMNHVKNVALVKACLNHHKVQGTRFMPHLPRRGFICLDDLNVTTDLFFKKKKKSWTKYRATQLQWSKHALKSTHLVVKTSFLTMLRSATICPFQSILGQIFGKVATIIGHFLSSWASARDKWWCFLTLPFSIESNWFKWTNCCQGHGNTQEVIDSKGRFFYWIEVHI